MLPVANMDEPERTFRLNTLDRDMPSSWRVFHIKCRGRSRIANHPPPSPCPPPTHQVNVHIPPLKPLTLNPSPLTLMLSLLCFLRTLNIRLKLWNFSSLGQKVTSIGTRPFGGKRAEVGVTSRIGRLRGSSLIFADAREGIRGGGEGSFRRVA